MDQNILSAAIGAIDAVRKMVFIDEKGVSRTLTNDEAVLALDLALRAAKGE